MSVLKRLWNGGLDSAGADPRKLAERRIISVGSFALIPSALILIVSNIFILGGNYTRVIVISMVMVVAILGLYLQAYRGWQRFAAISFISALWAAPVALMFDEGFSSSNWAWLLPVILLANFILSRRAAIVFTVLSVLVLIAFAVLTLQGQLGQPIDTNEHAITVAISGSIIFTLACMLGYYYRTSQMKSEEVLLDNMRTLQEEVEIRREAEEKALTAERAKTTFLTTVSHELRTPLNGVIGASQLLAGRKLGEEEGELVDIINSSAEILLEIINNVLDLSRLEKGRMEVHQLPMNLRSVVESAIKPLIIDCEAKQLDLNWSIAAEFPEHVISDGACIRQIILNLVGNAVKFTERGSIDITVTGTSEEIRLAVRDTGIGISDNEREQIFSPFVQASSASQTRVGGSGLGLSIVYRLVKLLGGSIEVESEVAVGSTFTVYLPIQPCSEAQVTKSIGQTTVAEDEWQHEDLNVLLADDNLINRTVANKMLQQLGCRVMEATDGHEAIALIEQNEFDLVLMDVQMPNMDGLTATGKIRQMEGQLSDLIIVGLSANAMPGDEARMLDAGMNACLSKPVRLEKLREALSLA